MPLSLGIVMATRDRRERVLATLEHLVALPGGPPVVLVDDASKDGTGDAAAAALMPSRRSLEGVTTAAAAT